MVSQSEVVQRQNWNVGRVLLWLHSMGCRRSKRTRSNSPDDTNCEFSLLRHVLSRRGVLFGKCVELGSRELRRERYIDTTRCSSKRFPTVFLFSAEGAFHQQPGTTPQEKAKSQDSGLKARLTVPAIDRLPPAINRAFRALGCNRNASWGVAPGWDSDAPLALNTYVEIVLPGVEATLE